MKSSSSCKIMPKRLAALAFIPLLVFALMAIGAPISQAKGYLSPPAIPSEPPDPTDPPDCFLLLTTISPPGGGTVARNPVKSPGCFVDGTYLVGAQVELTASANSGYGFDHWGGDATGSTNPTVVTIDVDPEVTAVFTPCYSLYVSVLPSVGGSVLRTPPNCPDGKYKAGTTVNLNATANPGNAFAYWGGDVPPLYNPTSVVMNGPHSVTAYFAQCFTLYVDVYPLGGGSVSATPPNCAGGMYRAGTSVTLAATPNHGFAWGYWTGNYSSFYNPVVLTMSQNRTTTANFLQQYYVYLPVVVR